MDIEEKIYILELHYTLCVVATLHHTTTIHTTMSLLNTHIK